MVGFKNASFTRNQFYNQLKMNFRLDSIAKESLQKMIYSIGAKKNIIIKGENEI